MEFRILGPLEVWDGARPVGLGGPRKRSTLAILLLNLNRVVSSERLIEELWGERTPPTALQTVRVHVSQIRKALGSDVVRTLPSGYVLEMEADQLDARRFERLVEEGTAAMAVGDAAVGAGVLREALALWRGPALADFVYEPFAQAAVARLEDLRLAALEARVDADLALGGHLELIGELRTLIAEQPLRERLWAQLMLALYRAGRQSEALAAYREAWQVLSDELGIEPSPELRNLERAMLGQDVSLDVGLPTRQRLAQASVRKTVTIVHVELGVARVEVQDPEALVGRLAGPLEHVSSVVERHGGVAIGRAADAVTAMFGVPSLHEDDALRATRAAVDVRNDLSVYDDLRPRIGIATGEIVASELAAPAGIVGGSAVRLAYAAQPREIVLDEATRRLVSNAVQVEQLASSSGFRLHALLRGMPPFARRLEAPLIGRRTELAQCAAAFERTVATNEPALVVVSGPPGIGKSRLAGELIRELASRATTLVGRCLSYGQGITLWPLREMVREAAGDETREAVGMFMQHEPDGPVVAENIAAALGLVDVDPPAEATVWAFRRLFEVLAAARPLVLVFEDVHWAEPALLDLLEYVARHAKGVPLLIVCLARPELLEARPAWAAAAVELAPLSSEETDALIDNLPMGPTLTPVAHGRVVTTAEGNPLFAEQLVALLAARGADMLPTATPTIHAILAARLDGLGPGERAVAERAAVVGREFTLEALVELLPPPVALVAGRHLDALARKMLVQSDRAVLPGKRGFRFQHALIHDAAYARLPKAQRAELHERVADWLENRAGARLAEFEEVVGYHLERACRYRLELGANDDAVRQLADRAAARLAATGRRAFQRIYYAAAVGLLERAVDLMAEGDPRSVELLNIVGTALGPLGEFDRQASVLDLTTARARRLGDRRGEWLARLERSDLNVRRQPSMAMREERHRLAKRALRVFEDLRDSLGVARAARCLAADVLDSGDASAAEVLADKALAHARASGVAREEVRCQWMLADVLRMGPTPVPTAIVRCEEVLEAAPDRFLGSVSVSGNMGVLRAMNGQFDEARQLVGDARSILSAISHPRPFAVSARWAGRIAILAGDFHRAEAACREGFQIARDIGEPMLRDLLAIDLADALCRLGRSEEAAAHLQDVAEPRKTGSAFVSAEWRANQARVLALRGDVVDAERLARHAVALVAPTDLLDLRGDVELALAEVLWAGGQVEAADAALEEALRLYQRKGNIAAMARARLLMSVHPPQP